MAWRRRYPWPGLKFTDRTSRQNNICIRADSPRNAYLEKPIISDWKFNVQPIRPKRIIYHRYNISVTYPEYQPLTTRTWGNQFYQIGNSKHGRSGPKSVNKHYILYLLCVQSLEEIRRARPRNGKLSDWRCRANSAPAHWEFAGVLGA